jgi:hypothetical protein
LIYFLQIPFGDVTFLPGLEKFIKIRSFAVKKDLNQKLEKLSVSLVDKVGLKEEQLQVIRI